MSWQAMETVLDTSQAQGTERNVALALASAAGPDGRNAYPSVPTLARRARCGESTVRKALTALVARGEWIEDGTGPNGTRRFHQVIADRAAPERTRASRPWQKPTPAGPAAPQDLRPRPVETPAVADLPRVEDQRLDVDALCQLLATEIRGNDPKAKVRPDSSRWRTDMRLLIDRDGRTPAEIEAVIRWAQADPFWRSNILSPTKLREKFSALLLKSSSRTNAPAVASSRDELAIYDRDLHEVTA